MTDTSPTGGFPVPTKEKVTKWAMHGGIAALGVVGVLTFMPYINKALDLLTQGLLSTLEMGLIVVALIVGAGAVMAFAPVYKRIIESLANKATWAVFTWDPITPMVEWLKDMLANLNELKAQYSNIVATIATTMQAVQENKDSAVKADKRFKALVAAKNPQATTMANDAAKYLESAQRIEQMVQPLNVVRDTFSKIIGVIETNYHDAEIDVDIFKKEFGIAQGLETATNAANRALNKGQRMDAAKTAMGIIKDKYNASLGRVQALNDLSQDLLSKSSADDATNFQEALERLQNESRIITGTAVEVQPLALPSAGSESTDALSLYGSSSKLNGSRTSVP